MTIQPILKHLVPSGRATYLKKLAAKTANINFARQIDKYAKYAAHIGTNEPTKIRPELEILRQAMLTRAAHNAKKKPGFFQRAKKAVVNLYKNIRGKVKRAKAKNLLLRASEQTSTYSSKINDARKYTQVQGDNFIFY